jgi:hypothetical protein
MNRRLSPICRKQVACRNNINICIYLYEKTSIVWEAKYGTYGKKNVFHKEANYMNISVKLKENFLHVEADSSLHKNTISV